jgi:hypothetical protein
MSIEFSDNSFIPFDESKISGYIPPNEQDKLFKSLSTIACVIGPYNHTIYKDNDDKPKLLRFIELSKLLLAIEQTDIDQYTYVSSGSGKTSHYVYRTEDNRIVLIGMNTCDPSIKFGAKLLTDSDLKDDIEHLI